MAQSANGQGVISRGFLGTERKDRWWIEPLATGLGFLCFVLYSTWAGCQGEHYWFGSYLSPFYSPLLFVDPTAVGAAPVEHAWFGLWPDWPWWPSFLPRSPAFFILAFPLSFRLTCYYYRKFYYRSFMLTPPGCAVGAVPQGNYRGETFLFLFQNLHRYALYGALVFIGILAYDAAISFFRNGQFGVGVGSIILTMNVVLISSYTFGCHSLRHLVGGRLNCLTCDGHPTVAYKKWSLVSWFNARHMRFAWLSLIWVGLTDVYVRLLSMGIIHDLSTWE